MSNLLQRLKFYQIDHVTDETKQGILDDIREAADEIERLQGLVVAKPKPVRVRKRSKP